MYLVDTCVFLEIKLNQAKKEICKTFLRNHAGLLHISDFSLHSFGIILCSYNLEDSFQHFVRRFLPNLCLLHLPEEIYSHIVSTKARLNLDFDDTYQYLIAKHHGLTIVTLDSDFRNVTDVPVIFL
jgi:predicted nucleic acid-binding protein